MSMFAKLRKTAAYRLWLLAYVAEERRLSHGEMRRYWCCAGYSAILGALAVLRLWSKAMSAAAINAPFRARLVAAQARAANAGAVLQLSHCDEVDPVVTVSRWNLIREFATLADAEKLLDRMGVPA